MKAIEIIPSVATKSVYMSWVDIPDGAVLFKVLSVRRGDPSSSSTGEETTAKLLGETTNSFFTDMRYFESSILRKETLYVIKALGVNGQTLDTLTINPTESASSLVQKVLNAANYRADRLFRNPNWAQTVYLLRYRKTGQKCKCYSRDFAESRNLDCEVCYGGGYVGGFYAPVPTRVLTISEDTSVQGIYTSHPDCRDVQQLTLPRYPGVYNGDFLVSDKLGFMSVVRTSFNQLQTSPTPTIMVTAAGLGKEHPVSRFDFESVKPAVSSIFIDRGEVFIRGENLVPVVGTVTMHIEEGPEELRGLKFVATDIKRITSSEIVFRSETQSYALQPFMKYRIFLNHQMFEGYVHAG